MILPVMDDPLWQIIRHETPIFWRLINERSCRQCDHGPLTPVPGHDTRRVIGASGFVTRTIYYRWYDRHGEALAG